jgi:hypothetical protein
MEQKEVKRPGNGPTMPESFTGDKPGRGSSASASNSGEAPAAKPTSGTVLDPSGDPAPRTSTVGRARELGRNAAGRLEDLTTDTADLIREKPVGATLSALGVGFVLGLALGILIGRD